METKKNKKVNKNKKKGKLSDITEYDDIEDDKEICFYDSNEERPLGEGESVVSAWSFWSVNLVIMLYKWFTIYILIKSDQ